MRAGFIGAGKVGFTLGKYLAMHGIEISGYTRLRKGGRRIYTEQILYKYRRNYERQ